jgi:hypothetical protein
VQLKTWVSPGYNGCSLVNGWIVSLCAYICGEQVSHRVPDACKRVAGLYEKEEKKE